MTAPYYTYTVRTSGGSLTSTFRMVETFDSWADALAFTRRLQNLKSKPSIRCHGGAWTVRYEPTLIAFNYGTAA